MPVTIVETIHGDPEETLLFKETLEPRRDSFPRSIYLQKKAGLIQQTTYKDKIRPALLANVGDCDEYSFNQIFPSFLILWHFKSHRSFCGGSIASTLRRHFSYQDYCLAFQTPCPDTHVNGHVRVLLCLGFKTLTEFDACPSTGQPCLPVQVKMWHYTRNGSDDDTWYTTLSARKLWISLGHSSALELSSFNFSNNCLSSDAVCVHVHGKDKYPIFFPGCQKVLQHHALCLYFLLVSLSI